MNVPEREDMRNFTLFVRSRSLESLTSSIAIAMNTTPGGRVTHQCTHPRFGLVLFWRADAEDRFQGIPIVPLPEPMQASDAADFAWLWLSKADRTQFRLRDMDARQGVEDAHFQKAFRATGGQLGGSNFSVIAILPVWAWIGR